VIPAPAAAYDARPTSRGDLIRLIIEFRIAYEKLCGIEPTCIHVSAGIAAALAAQGFRSGTLVAGMRIICRAGEPADEAVCSRDERLFAEQPPKPKRVAAK
jgi:hypothetical protein